MSQNPQMRYQFLAPTSDRPNYVKVFDTKMRDFPVELYIEHAMIISMMYQNQWKHNPFAADEFMYGHILGMTYSMIHADKYPKVETTRDAAGNVFMKMTQPDGASKTFDVAKEGNARGSEMIGRIVTPPADKDKH